MLTRLLASVAAASLALGVPILPKETPTCSKVAIVAARGSDQNGPEDVIPTEYGPGNISNGYEARNIRGLLQLANQRHEGLLTEVPIIALDPSVYSASLGLPPLTEPGQQLSPSQILVRLVEILIETPAPVIAYQSLSSVLSSARDASEQTPEYLAQWEKEQGCQPDYILIGYSQGASVLSAQEEWLAQAGRLRGVIYLGNPYGEKGFLSFAPTVLGIHSAPGVPRVEYCLPDDFSCDASLFSAAQALADGMSTHTHYFTGPAAETDAPVADALAEMIKAVD